MKKALLLLAGWLLFAAAPSSFADSQFKLLILAIPNKYHYEYIPTARDSMEALARLHAFEFTWTNKAQVLEGDLRQYAAVVLMNTAIDDLSEVQRKKFEDYMAAGGNAVVVHRALIAQPGVWPWFEKLVGRSFTTHPMLQTGVVTVLDKDFPATFGVPQRWIWSDEWYVFTNPHAVSIHPVLNVDESSYDPTKIWPGQVSRGMGKDHPVAWYRWHGQGRVFVTTLGHNGEMYKDPTYIAHLWGGMWWAATGKGVQK